MREVDGKPINSDHKASAPQDDRLMRQGGIAVALFFVVMVALGIAGHYANPNNFHTTPPSEMH